MTPGTKDQKKIYIRFKEWVTETFMDSEPSNEQWAEILEDDRHQNEHEVVISSHEEYVPNVGANEDIEQHDQEDSDSCDNCQEQLYNFV